jgi:hypothetical protein
MATANILALLVAERDRLSRAIEALQGPIKRRGRPPKNADGFNYAAANVPDWVKPASERKTAAAAPKKERKKRVFTAAQRNAQGLRMKKFWAVRRKVKAKA